MLAKLFVNVPRTMSRQRVWTDHVTNAISDYTSRDVTFSHLYTNPYAILIHTIFVLRSYTTCSRCLRVRFNRVLLYYNLPINSIIGLQITNYELLFYNFAMIIPSDLTFWATSSGLQQFQICPEEVDWSVHETKRISEIWHLINIAKPYTHERKVLSVWKTMPS